MGRFGDTERRIRAILPAMKLLACAAALGLGVLGCSSDSEPAAPQGPALTDTDAGDTDTRIAPIIPEPSGACPEFVTGKQDIMGLSTSVVAGAPGATKGPLLITFHGTGGNGDGALRQLPQSVQNDIVAQGGVVVAPSNTAWSARGRT